MANKKILAIFAKQMSNHQLAEISHSKYEKNFSHKVRKIQNKYANEYIVM